MKKLPERTFTGIMPVMNPNQKMLSLSKKQRFVFRKRNHSTFWVIKLCKATQPSGRAWELLLKTEYLVVCRKDTLCPLRWAFPVLWDSDVILYSSYIYMISWRAQHVLCLLNILKFSLRAKYHSPFKLPSRMADIFDHVCVWQPNAPQILCNFE